MRVKIFSEPWSGDPRGMETIVNEFLATLTTASIKHVHTAVAAAAESNQMRGETVITIWYDDLAELKTVSEVSEAEIIEFSEHSPMADRSA
jgi:hypothetical protein